MIKRHLVLSSGNRIPLLLGTISLALGIFLTRGSNDAGISHGPEATSPATGDADDASARMRFEWLMLRDPKSGQIPAHIRQQEMEFASVLPRADRVIQLGKGRASIKSATWSQRGPFNVGGRTRALALDVTNENVILAGGASGGMWRSTDGGASWNRTSPRSVIVQSVTCVAQDTRVGKTNTWYYGTGEYTQSGTGGGGAYYQGDGIFKSTDGGISWFVLPTTSLGRPQSFSNFFDYVWNIVTDPNPSATSDNVYAATYGTISRSSDGGNTWYIYLGDVQGPYSTYTDVAISRTGILYATLSSEGPQRGIWRSVDGITWTNITPPHWPTTYNRIVIGIAPSNENIVYFMGETPASGKKDESFWKYRYISGDGAGIGGVWEDRSSNLPAYGGRVGDFYTQGSYDMVVKPKPDNENIVFLGGTALFRSTDGFASQSNTSWIGGFSTINDGTVYPNHYADQHAVVFPKSNPNILFSGCDGGISKTTNDLASTVSWTSLNNGYMTSQFYSIAVDQATAGSPTIIGGMQDNSCYVMNSNDWTVPWSKITTGDGGFCAIADHASYYYGSAQEGLVYRFQLSGTGAILTWAEVMPTGASGFLFITPYVLDPNNSDRMFMAAGSTIWRNSGLSSIPTGYASPTSVNWDSLGATYLPGRVISALAVSKTPANRLYFGTTDGKAYRLDGVDTPTPNVLTSITGSQFPVNAYVSCIAVDPANADNVLLVFSNYGVVSLFYSSNGGSAWTAVAGNLEQYSDGTGDGPSCRWASILPIGSVKLYLVGTSVGLYSTTALSSSTVWTQEGSSTIGSVVVPMVVTRQIDGTVTVATHANGVFSGVVTSVPTAPTLASPLNGRTGVPTSPMLSWNPSSDAASYTLQVSRDSSFVTLTVNKSEIIDTSYQVSSLSNGSLYFWRVSASSAGGASPFSSVAKFTTIAAVPLAPELVSPLDNAAGIATGTKLVWNVSAGAVSYRLQVSTALNFAAMVMDDSTITDTSKSLGSLQRNSKYYWRLSAKSEGGWSAPSASRSFNTNTRMRGDVDGNGVIQAEDASIVLRHIVGLAVLTDPNALYAADANADGTITAFDASLILQVAAGLIPPPTGNVDAGKLGKGVDQATGGLELTSSSTAIDPTVVNVGIKLSHPTNVCSIELTMRGDFRGASVDAVNASPPDGWNVKWNVIGNELRIAAAGTTPLSAGDIAEITFHLMSKESRLSFSTDVLLNENYQSLSPFQVAAVPTTFALGQNYPNPFNPSTTIPYSVPSAATVSLKIFNALGQEVAVLVNDQVSAGYYQARWDANVPSGIYFYRLQARQMSGAQAGGFVETKKMVVVR